MLADPHIIKYKHFGVFNENMGKIYSHAQRASGVKDFLSFFQKRPPEVEKKLFQVFFHVTKILNIRERSHIMSTKPVEVICECSLIICRNMVRFGHFGRILGKYQQICRFDPLISGKQEFFHVSGPSHH